MKKLIVFTDDDCPIRYACHAIQGKWKLPVIYVLCANGTLRYNELKKALGITNVMLSNTLKEMEEEGLVLRTQYNEIPPRVDYSLTEAAAMLLPIIKEFYLWGEYLMEHEKESCCADEKISSERGCSASRQMESFHSGLPEESYESES